MTSARVVNDAAMSDWLRAEGFNPLRVTRMRIELEPGNRAAVVAVDCVAIVNGASLSALLSAVHADKCDEVEP